MEEIHKKRKERWEKERDENQRKSTKIMLENNTFAYIGLGLMLCSVVLFILFILSILQSQSDWLLLILSIAITGIALVIFMINYRFNSIANYLKTLQDN